MKSKEEIFRECIDETIQGLSQYNANNKQVEASFNYQCLMNICELFHEKMKAETKSYIDKDEGV